MAIVNKLDSDSQEWYKNHNKLLIPICFYEENGVIHCDEEVMVELLRESIFNFEKEGMDE
jgi:hypothetical protein